MDWVPLETFLLVREGKAQVTVAAMMRRFRRMEELGFDFQAFARSEAEAQAAGDSFLLKVRKAGITPDGLTNLHKNLMALLRFHKWRGVEWAAPKQIRRAPQIYSLEEVHRLLRLTYTRSLQIRMWRAVVTAHNALGWRVGELAKLEEQHLNAGNHSVFLAHPEKGNPQRHLPLPPLFFSKDKAFMSWVRHRPVAKENPQAIWTYKETPWRWC